MGAPPGLFVLAIVALAGCSASSSSSTSDSSTGHIATPSVTTSTISEPAGNMTDLAPGFAECRGASSYGSLPGIWGPEPIHPSWQETDPAALAAVGFFVFSCERVAFGNVSRGPVSFAVEYHQFAAVPETCFENRDRVYVMANLWANDTAFAEAMGSWHGMPWVVAGVQRTTDPDVPGQERWALDAGLGESVFDASDPDLPEIEESLTVAFAWQDGDGIAMLQLTNTYTTSNFDAVFSSGEMRAPTVWQAQSHGVPYEGIGDVYNSAELTASLFAYKDPSCRAAA